MKTLIALSAVVALSVPSTANAADWKDNLPCATDKEVFHTPGGLTRTEVEERWGVQGKGQKEYFYLINDEVWFYPACKPWDKDAEFKVAFVYIDKHNIYGTWKHE